MGERPVAYNCTKYEWLYAYGFVHPHDGNTTWLLLPTVSAAAMNIALRTFEREANPMGKKLILLLIDQAGFHTTKKLEIPPSIIFFPLPPHTPELQPTECIWPLLRETVANRSFTTLDALEDILITRCQWLIKNPAIVRGKVGFSWISRALKLEESD